jgi:hypothetical protein
VEGPSERFESTKRVIRTAFSSTVTVPRDPVSISRGKRPLFALLTDYNDNMKKQKLPLFAATRLALESSHVVALRLPKLAAGGRYVHIEARRMVTEKISEAMAAGAILMGGGSGSRVIARYRRRVRANARRLANGR